MKISTAARKYLIEIEVRKFTPRLSAVIGISARKQGA